MGFELTPSTVEAWLREMDEHQLEQLWREADRVRRENVGDTVHLRGLIEISNHCCRLCGYCGLRADNRGLERYRMSREEILQCAQMARDLGFGTVVMQAGEDYGITRDWLADIIREIKRRHPDLAITLSLGERPDEDLLAWKNAGADRYLLRFETSDPDLYALIHPPAPGRTLSDRIAQLKRMREMGYEIGSGIMVGIPGQTYSMVARDILLFRELDLDMIGMGPYISHPATPLARMEPADPRAAERIRLPMPAPEGEQVPNSELMTYKVVALTRLACPEANIPSTTALATLNLAQGRELGLQRGANIVMPNLTPVTYRRLYEIYPAKACIAETPDQCYVCLKSRILRIGREIGTGPGGRRRLTSTVT